METLGFEMACRDNFSRVIGEHLPLLKFLTFQRFQRTTIPVVIDEDDDEGICFFDRLFYRHFKVELECGILIDGKKEGLWVSWHLNGQIRKRGSYHEEKAEGIWTHWYENGQVHSRGRYVKGKKNGFWEYYHRNGRMSSMGQYVNGDPDGLWEFRNEDGVLTARIEYRDGVEIDPGSQSL